MAHATYYVTVTKSDTSYETDTIAECDTLEEALAAARDAVEKQAQDTYDAVDTFAPNDRLCDFAPEFTVWEAAPEGDMEIEKYRGVSEFDTRNSGEPSKILTVPCQWSSYGIDGSRRVVSWPDPCDGYDRVYVDLDDSIEGFLSKEDSTQFTDGEHRMAGAICLKCSCRR